MIILATFWLGIEQCSNRRRNLVPDESGPRFAWRTYQKPALEKYSLFWRVFSARPSVCPSFTRVDQSKTVEVRIIQTPPQNSPVSLVFAICMKFWRVPMSADISKRYYSVDTTKVSVLLGLMNNRKLHMHFRLTRRSMTLDDLELLLVQIFSEFCTTLHCWVNRYLLLTVWLWRMQVKAVSIPRLSRAYLCVS